MPYCEDIPTSTTRIVHPTPTYLPPDDTSSTTTELEQECPANTVGE